MHHGQMLSDIAVKVEEPLLKRPCGFCTRKGNEKRGRWSRMEVRPYINEFNLAKYNIDLNECPITKNQRH